MRNVDPQTLSVTHIVDGEEVVTGSDDGQAWVATFFDRTTAELFIQWCCGQNVYPGGQKAQSVAARKAQPKSVNAELLATLSELLTAQLTQMPPYEAGKEAQDAWADRRASARNNASAAIANAMALARKYASECDCDGTGVTHTKQWPGGIEVDGEKPCEACEDIRRVLREIDRAEFERLTDQEIT